MGWFFFFFVGIFGHIVLPPSDDFANPDSVPIGVEVIPLPPFLFFFLLPSVRLPLSFVLRLQLEMVYLYL